MKHLQATRCVHLRLPEPAQDSVESTFDVEKELEEVNKRLRDQSARQLLTPNTKSPDWKRLKSQQPIQHKHEDAAGVAASARSGTLEDGLHGLPQGSPPKTAPTSTPAASAPSATSEPAPPSKLPSPCKPAALSPRNLMPQLEDVEKNKTPEAMRTVPCFQNCKKHASKRLC